MSRYFQRMVTSATKDFLSGLVAMSVGAWKGLKSVARMLGDKTVEFKSQLSGGDDEIAVPPRPKKRSDDPSLPSDEEHEAYLSEIEAELEADAATSDGPPVKKKPSKRVTKKRWHFLSAAGSAGLALLMAGLIVNLRFAATVLPDDEVDLWTINRPTSLTFLDRNGEFLGQRGIRYADPVPLEEMPPYLKDAFLATEDRRFYGHRGYDLRGLMRAGIANLRAGGVVEGGSTITQQLAKNLFLEPDRTLKRKLEELQFALWLEARLSKDEILSLYLNRTYLGAGTYGVEAASQAYFSKSARDLTVGEAALLAGLPKAPSTLAPTINPDGAVARSREVIDNLIETRRIDEVEGRMAKEVPPDLNLAQRETAYGYFLDYVAQRIEQRLGSLDRDLVVTTSLDKQLQIHAEDAVVFGIDDEARARGAEQAALIAFDREGGIVAMAGGLDYEDSQFNRASQARRQPGSAFKPFVFLAALEAGMQPGSIVIDRPIKVGDWAPTNYNEKHIGPLRLADAAARSTNSVAVQITEGIGRDRVIDAAQRAGITTALDPVASLARGSVGVPLLELTAAYMPFAHHGAETPAHAVMEIRTRSGEVLYEYEPIPGFNVIEPAKADDTARLLISVMDHGTGARGKFGSHPVGGKTGTTNNWRDAWFIGFTHYYTAGVWVGNDEARGMDKVSGATIPLTIWKDFMERAHEDLSPVPLLEDPNLEGGNIRDVAGLYASLRSDLINTAYPIPQVDWAVIEEPAPRRRRGFFGLGSRPDPEPQGPVQPQSPGVVGNAAPGLETEPENDGQ